MYIRTENGVVKMTDEEALAYAESQKTPEQVKEEKIVALKKELIDTDYQSYKAFEGVPSEDWEAIKARREEIRLEIRGL